MPTEGSRQTDFVCSGVLGWQSGFCSGAQRHEVSLVYSPEHKALLWVADTSPSYSQVNFCDLGTLVDNRYSMDTQQGVAGSVLNDKTQAFDLSAAIASIHDPNLENTLPQDRLHTYLRSSGPRAGAQRSGLGLRTLDWG